MYCFKIHTFHAFKDLCSLIFLNKNSVIYGDSRNFNVIHIGHLRLFSYAKKIANHLIVGVISDETSRANLLIGQDKRLDGVKSNKFVDEAYIINGNLKDFISK